MRLACFKGNFHSSTHAPAVHQTPQHQARGSTQPQPIIGSIVFHNCAPRHAFLPSRTGDTRGSAANNARGILRHTTPTATRKPATAAQPYGEPCHSGSVVLPSQQDHPIKDRKHRRCYHTHSGPLCRRLTDDAEGHLGTRPLNQ